LNPDNISATPDFSAPTQAPAFSDATATSGSAIPFTSDVILPTASVTLGNAVGHRGLSNGAKAGIGIGVAISILSIIGFIIFFILHRRKRSASAPERSHSKESSHLSENSFSNDLESESTRPEIDSKPIQEADGSMLTGHELDSTPVKLELESRSNWPVEIDGRGVWPKEKEASLFGHWSQT
jgi:hypothetical protein